LPVTAYDASLILQYSAGLITSFTAGNKKSGMANADVSITIENGFVVFRSSGDLFGLNITVPKDFNNLGQPQVLNTDMISAFNINQTTYAIGLATAFVPKSGDIFMKIPIIGSPGVEVTFNMIVNTVYKTVTISLITGVDELNDESISLFPNPVTNELKISNISQNSTISIYNSNGKLLISKTSRSSIEKIDVSSLINGVYLIRITENKTSKTFRLIKQ
jgi:hypothetical protein